MASQFKLTGIFIRFIVALLLVFATFNPSGYSYVHLAMNPGEVSIPLIALMGIALVIGWAVFLRATLRSLGPIGIVLAAALFGCFVWLAVDLNWLSFGGQLFVYIILVICAAVLAIGMSWSHLRRRMSGQADMDDVDE